jgi:hypothetical protein
MKRMLLVLVPAAVVAGTVLFLTGIMFSAVLAFLGMVWFSFEVTRPEKGETK